MSAAPYEGALREPFGLTASVDDYVPSAAIERALHEASVALDDGRVPVVAGPPGLGKTLVLQLLGRARADRCQPVYVPFCSLTPEELATLVLGLLDWSRESDPEVALLEAARRSAEDGRRLLLLVDDAASLPGDTAAQLAHWLNASAGALQVALAGFPGPSLSHARDAFGDRAQAVTLDEGLRDDEIAGYVSARLEAAGASPEVRAAFDEATLAELARTSGGNPRRLNLAAQSVMRRAFGEAVDAAAAAEAATGADGGEEGARTPEAPVASAPPTTDAGVGEYRFVRGRLVGPGGEAPAEAPGNVWREELTATERELARRREAKPAEPPAPPVTPPPAPRRPAPPPEPDFEDDFGQALRDDDPLFDELGTPLDAPASEQGEEDGPTPEPAGAGPAASEQGERDDAWTSRLEPPPPAKRSSRRLLWIAAGVAGLAFAVGAWTQLSRPEPPTRGATLTALRKIEERKAQEQGAVQPAPTAEETREAPAAPPAEEVVEDAPAAPSGEEVAGEIPNPQEIAEAPPTPEPELAVAPEAAAAAAEPAPSAAASVEPAPSAAAPAAAPAEPAPPPAETVGVAINATPWAVIEIDGEEVGETPLAGIELTTGRHRFRARMPDGSVRERVVRIDRENTTVVFE